MPNYAVRLSEEREEEPPQPTAASQGLGSQAHLMDKSRLWPRGENRQRRGSGSAEGDGDAFILDKNNVSMMFFNSGNNVDPNRLEVFANNLFLADVHVFAVAEAQENIIVMIENTGKYRAHWVPNSALVCLSTLSTTRISHSRLTGGPCAPSTGSFESSGMAE